MYTRLLNSKVCLNVSRVSLQRRAAYRINKHYGTLIPLLVRHYFRVLAAIGKLPVKRIYRVTITPANFFSYVVSFLGLNNSTAHLYYSTSSSTPSSNSSDSSDSSDSSNSSNSENSSNVRRLLN